MLAEIKKLQRAELGGITLKLNTDDISGIQAIIEGPENTPFEGGEFLIKLEVDNDFPQKAPNGYFLTPIFHPNVAYTGAICLNMLSQDWPPELGLDHILLTVRCLLVEPNPASALNEEAGRLLLQNYDDFCARARLMTQIHAMRAAPAPAAKASAAEQTRKCLKRL
jgi:ubiquitin-conjugating enzyme E2 S